MDAVYGKGKTYKYELDKDRMEWLTNKTNRARHQTQFLFQLVDGDFDMLVLLECKIKNLHVHYCPGTKEKVHELIKTDVKNEWFRL